MKLYRLLIIAIAACFTFGLAVCYAHDGLILAQDGKSDYSIVISSDPSDSTRYAAEELQVFLKKMTGAEIPISSEPKPDDAKLILLGDSNRMKELDVTLNLDLLGDDGYIIQTRGTYLIIAGSAVRGNLYGVYGLLEDHLGCRWFTPEVSRIPTYTKLKISSINEQQIPVLKERDVFIYECFDPDWCARNRLSPSYPLPNGKKRLEKRHGGEKTYWARRFAGHTFRILVPPEKYFYQHPEYFSLVNGKRLKNRTQLCTMNEDVIRICTERILEEMRTQPNAKIFMVSQNDWDNWCECDKCQELAKKEDSKMAPVLYLVNRVADNVKSEFPDKLVGTFAYTWTRKPPTTMRPRDNVLIRLCSLECCFAHPMSCDCRGSVSFREDVKNWTRICSRVWVWDYITAFKHYLIPFPNNLVFEKNIKFLVEQGVTGIFEQGSFNTPHAELASLQGYMLSKFLWNPDYSEEKALSEFLDAYYGNAAKDIRAYIYLFHNYVKRHNIHIGLFTNVRADIHNVDLLSQADKIMADAEKHVAGDSKMLNRVKNARMSVDYAILERSRVLVEEGEEKDNSIIDLARVRFAPFFETLKISGMTRLTEHTKLNYDTYRKGLAKVLKIEDEF